MARKCKSAVDTHDTCPQDLNEIPYIGWMNKQIAAGRKPAGPVPEGIPSAGGTSFEAPRDVPSRVHRGADRVASSRTVDDDTFANEIDEDDFDYNENDDGSDDDNSGDEEDKGMSDNDDEAEADEVDAPEEVQPETQAARRGRPTAARGGKTAPKGGDPPCRAPKSLNQIPVKRSVWFQRENPIFVAARWFAKDDLEPLIGKQGSQYWACLVAHIEKENPGWVHGTNAVQKQWRNLLRIYKQLKKGERASGKGAVCKPPWWPYMELYQDNRATAGPHAVDGGGATNVHVPCGFAVPSTSARATLTPTFTEPPPQSTPTSKRPRVVEIATMAASKLVCDTIKGCHVDVMSKLEGLPTTAGAGGADDGWYRRPQAEDASANPEAPEEEVWVRGASE
ncbi:unnamed protein product [Closterium sp. Yama58-4]|nr:unnamed protein product [Closterium sp. Yama58-4]